MASVELRTLNPNPHELSAAQPGLDLRYYLAILEGRALWLIVPLLAILSVGSAIVMLLKPIYLAEGRILVETQQIPTELVRSTVTASSKERIQIIEQRVMTRENLLAVIEKFRLFPDKRHTLSSTELLDLVRLRTRFQPYELDQARRRSDSVTIALAVAFEYEDPQLAMRVANEMMTLILAEDARNRASRARETTNFLTKEVKKLEADLGAVEGQIAEVKRRNTVEPISERLSTQLLALRAELQEKSAVYTSRHPEIMRLTKQVAALEEVTKKSTQVENGLEILLSNRALIQKNIEVATQKVTAARLGESLEAGQFAERLQVLESAIVPQKPIKPNRRKLLMYVLGLALATGVGTVVLVEMLNPAIRSSSALAGVIDARMLVAIPYIVTAKERVRRKTRAALAAGVATASGFASLAAAHVFWKPIDELWMSLLIRLAG